MKKVKVETTARPHMTAVALIGKRYNIIKRAVFSLIDKTFDCLIGMGIDH